MKAVVIAAGEGERLKPYSDIFPKIMFPVGGKPIGRIIVETLRYYNFTDIIFCISKQWSKYIHDYFGDGRRFNVNIQYSESEKALGTAGEVKNAQSLITDDFLIYYGDVLTKINLRELYETHIIHKDNPIYMGTLAVQDMVNTEVGLIETNHADTITKFVEKAKIYQNNWSAIAILKKKVLDLITPEENDFGTHIFPKIIKEGLSLKIYINVNSWGDVGNIRSYKRINEEANKNEDYA